MAVLEIAGGYLELKLTTAEKLEAVHGDLRVPLSCVVGIEVVDDAHKASGIGARIKVGTSIPGVIEVASFHGTKTVFAAVHRGTPRGVRVTLTGAAWDEWIVGSVAPEGVVSSLTAVLP